MNRSARLRRSPALLLAALALLGGCAVSSLPIQFLQLSDGSPAPATSDRPVILLDAVVLPDFLLRDELLLRESDVLVRYAADRRWSEPLDLGIQRVVAARLEQELDTRQVIRFPDVPGISAEWRLRVEIRHFETVGNEVLLGAEGRWESTESIGTTISIIQFEERAVLPSDSAQDIARSMSELLWQFSTALATGLRDAST